MTKKFVLIGAAGYIAPKHMNAIKKVDGELIACLDPHDSVGILDSYFPSCKYFSEFERFDRYCSDQEIDYCVVCSPNYLHDAHCRFGLRIGADVICEKPLVLNEHNLDGLIEMENKTGHKIWNILQLRLTDTAYWLKTTYSVLCKEGNILVSYHTPRGDWYDYSWKADITKSGGLATNIGVHLLDLLLWVFGKDYEFINWKSTPHIVKGNLKIGGFNVSILLSIGKYEAPKRLFLINGDKYELSDNFNDLHTKSYHEILAGRGFGIEDVRPGIQLCEFVRLF